MSRLATSILVLAAAAGTPAFTADWGSNSAEDIYREAYSIEPADWTEMGDDSDGIHLDTAGQRYYVQLIGDTLGL